MPSRLPSLAALRTFEAAARHESFKDAATELAVTPVAVTRQVKALEQQLGLPLFERHHRRVVLTDAGRDLARSLEGAFADMRDAVERMRRRAGRRVLRIGVDRIFAERWLQPRVPAFAALHPEIDLVLVPSDSSPDEVGATVASIYYGSRLRSSPHRHLLFRDTVFPVCSPSLLRGPHPLAAPADLRGHRLLHEGSVDWWQRWLAVAGIEDIELTSGPVFVSPGRAYEAAVAGKGIVIGDDIITADDLLDGRLIRPFAAHFDGGTYALAIHGDTSDPALAAFVEWLLATCRAHKARMKAWLGLEPGRRGSKA